MMSPAKSPPNRGSLSLGSVFLLILGYSLALAANCWKRLA